MAEFYNDQMFVPVDVTAKCSICGQPYEDHRHHDSACPFVEDDDTPKQPPDAHERFMALVTAGLEWLAQVTGIPVSDEARVIMMAIAGQEGDWQYRRQIGGPAHSFWQFEEGGGVAGVLSHPASSAHIQKVCDLIYVSCDTGTVYTAMEWNDRLAVAMARLLLFTDAAALPKVGDVNGSWQVYQRNWRPGAPHPETWPDKYAIAMSLL
jgi:hypothetical protein